MSALWMLDGIPPRHAATLVKQFPTMNQLIAFCNDSTMYVGCVCVLLLTVCVCVVVDSMCVCVVAYLLFLAYCMALYLHAHTSTQYTHNTHTIHTQYTHNTHIHTTPPLYPHTHHHSPRSTQQKLATLQNLQCLRPPTEAPQVRERQSMGPASAKRILAFFSARDGGMTMRELMGG